MGVVAGIGALYVGLASYGNSHLIRVKRMILTAFVVSVLTGAGFFAGPSILLTVVGSFVVALIFAAYGAASGQNAIVGILGTAIFIITAGLPGHHSPIIAAVSLFFGGLLQAFIITLFSRFLPHRVERRAVAEAFSALVFYVATDNTDIIPGGSEFDDANTRLREGIHLVSASEYASLTHALRVAETIRAGLVGFAKAHRLLRRMGEGPLQAAEAVRREVLEQLIACENGIRKGQIHLPPFSMPEFENPIREMSELLRWTRLIQASLDDLRRGAPDSAIAPEPETDAKTLSLTLRNLTLRHSVRFGLAIAAGTALYKFQHVPFGYWVPLTTCFLLRPDYGTTLIRGAERFVGTLLGVIVATVLSRIFHGEIVILLSLSIFFAWVTFATLEIHFAGYIAALTAYVELGLTMQGIAEGQVALLRVGATFVGAFLSIVATVVWPIWESPNVRRVLKEAFEAQLAFGESVVYMGGPSDYAEAERKKAAARRLRIEAERLLNAAHLEPNWSHKEDLQTLRQAIEALHENAAVMLSLHANSLEVSLGRVEDDPTMRARLQRAVSEARLMINIVGQTS